MLHALHYFAMSLRSFVRHYALTCYPFEGDKEDRFIATLIHHYMRGKRVLDLGCGPVVPVVGVFYPNATEVVAVDRLQANLDFVKYHSDELRDIIARAQNYKRRYLSKKITTPRYTLLKGDITKKLRVGSFDSVMNLGSFGALNSPRQFQLAVNHAYSYLKKGGTLLMVNWVGAVKRPYNFNGKVYEPDVFKPSLLKAGFTIQELHLTGAVLSKETKKMGYSKIIWAVAKK